MSEDKDNNGAVAAGTDAAKLCKQSKEEAAAKPLFSRKEKLAFLSALLFSSGSLLIRGGGVAAQFSTQNALLAARIRAVVEDLTGRSCVERTYGKTHEIVAENAYALLIACHVLEEDGGNVCEHISPALTDEQNAAAAFVRGAYLGSGSLSAYKYHLEVSFSKMTIAEDFAALLARFDIAAKVAVRASRAVVYSKDSEQICDFLACIGAAKAVLRLNSLLVDRQMREYVNRRRNCDMHNIDKQVEAGVRQCAYLKELDERSLSPQLCETAAVRLANPDCSYEQLAAMLGVSKSGVKNRLRRLREIYEQSKEITLDKEKGDMVFRETTVQKDFDKEDAQKLVVRAMRFDSEIVLEFGMKKANAKSLMGVLGMALRAGDAVTAIAKGDDQEEALDAVLKLLSAK